MSRPRNYRPLLILSALLALGLTACGQKGGLTRPEQSSLTNFVSASHQTTTLNSTAMTDQ